MANIAPADLWLDLTDAARYLGVHFTTLRRWADHGHVPCMRTPGGQRRFALADLQRFVAQARQPLTPDSPSQQLMTLDLARQHIRQRDVHQQTWFTRLSEEQRQRFRSSGQRMVALLMQYSARSDNGDSFIDEGKRMAADYGAVCREAGLSATDTTRVFLFFRRSILDSIHETTGLAGPNDQDSQRLYSRMSDFLDLMLLATLDGFSLASQALSPKP